MASSEKKKSGEPVNSAIRCSVSQCVFHGGNQANCTLSSISIASHEAFPTQQESTDCSSFQLKGSN